MNKNIGKVGEQIAASYLKKNGLQIIGRQLTFHWGEIDLVAKQNNKIHFIEVKTRLGTTHGKPYEAITFSKIKSLKRAIEYYILKNKLKNYKLSLDVISIILNEDQSIKKLNYYENVEGG
jgi:putative endonuclease